METKHCAHCRQIQPVDALVCDRCGRPFVKKQRGRSLSRAFSKPSLPAASPHRAGHYSGLHPEDQPYQSSVMMAQRSDMVAATHREMLQAEPEQIVLSPPNATPQLQREERRQRSTPTEQETPLWMTWLSQHEKSNVPALPAKVIPILLTLACLFLLLASSILAFVLLGQHTTVATPAVWASPDVLRADDTFIFSGKGFNAHSLLTFTHDANQTLFDDRGHPLQAHTDAQGAFMLRLRVPHTWQPGVHSLHATDEAQKLGVSTHITVQQAPSTPPALRLATTTYQFPAAAAGVVSSQDITLINDGGGQLVWQESSDQPWLTVTPGNGSFSGREDVRVSVNRGALAPQTYIGHVSFRSHGAGTAILAVTMGVSAQPAVLGLSTSALNYSATTTQNPADQTITLQNSGDQTLNWNAIPTTGDGSSWLFVSPSSGHLAPHSSTSVLVHVEALQLSAGSYQGVITFGGAANAQVAVACTVTDPGNLVISPPSLNATVEQGQIESMGNALTLQNSGGATLKWSASASTADPVHWLSVTPASGTIVAGNTANLAMNIDATALSPGAYQGTLTFSAAKQSWQISIALTVVPPAQAVISVSSAPITFTVGRGQAPTVHVLTLQNTGQVPLDWQASEEGDGASFLAVAPAQGTLNPGESITLKVTPNVTNAQPGTLTTAIILTDTDFGVQVPDKRIPVSVTVTAPPAATPTPTATSTASN